MPATPAPAPTAAVTTPAPATTTPTPAPATAPEKSASDTFDTAFADLPPVPEPAPPKAPDKPTTPKAPEKGATAPAAKPEEFVEEDGVQVPKKYSNISNKDFRGWGLAGYKKAKLLEQQVQELSALKQEYDQLKQQVPATTAEKQALAEQLEKVRKEYNDLNEEVKLFRYERSGEYKEKYEKPREEAVKRAFAEVKELMVETDDPNGEQDADGNVKRIERPATWEDFEGIFKMPLGKATKEAKKMFGDAASIVLGHRQKIKDLAESAIQAVNQYKERAGEIEKEQHAKQVEEQNRIASTWTEVNQKLSADPRAAEFWGEEKEDKEANAELAKGFAFADKRFSEDYESMTTQEKILLDAAIRHRVAGFSKMAFLNRKLRTENEQLKKDIAELRAGGPGEPAQHGETPPVEEDEGALKAFDRKF